MAKLRTHEALDEVERDCWQCTTCSQPAEEADHYCRYCRSYWDDCRNGLWDDVEPLAALEPSS